MHTELDALERLAERRASEHRCDTCSAPIPAHRLRCVDCLPRPLPPAWRRARQRLAEHVAGASAEPTATEVPALNPPTNDRQRRRMFAVLDEAGIVDRAERLAFTAAAIGRTVDTSNELDADELGRTIAAALGVVDGSLGVIVSEHGWQIVAVESAGVRP